MEGSYRLNRYTKNKISKINERTFRVFYNLERYFARKLYLVNCAHSIIGYAGKFRNFRYVAEAFDDDEIKQLVEGSLRESCFGLSQEYDFSIDELDTYVENLRRRFSDHRIRDETQRVGRDPIRKLQRNERLIGPAMLAYEHGRFPEFLCRSIAHLLKYNGDSEGQRLQDKIRDDGVRGALAEYTGLAQDHKITERIALEYEKL